MESHRKPQNSNWLNSKIKERSRKELHFVSPIIFSKLLYRSGRKIIRQNRSQALAASIQTLGCGHALARSAVSALAGRS